MDIATDLDFIVGAVGRIAAPRLWRLTAAAHLIVIRVRMKLPAAERAVIPAAKIRDYLLSTSHPVGRFKAPFFASLGYTNTNWRRLEEDLRDLAVSSDAELGKGSLYGQNYEIRGILSGPSGGLREC